MRAVFIKSILDTEAGDVIELGSGEAKHLIKVVRIRAGEQILIQNGRGLAAHANVSEVGKTTLSLEVKRVERYPDISKIDLLLGVPKKEAFEEIIRDAIELRIGKIYFYRSYFSQKEHELKTRIYKIQESACIQSNAPYLTELISIKSDEIEKLIEKYQTKIYLSSKELASDDEFNNSCDNKTLMVVGPEGGMSSEEEELFKKLNVHFTHLPTNILRSPTAVAAGVGYILGSQRA